MPAAWEQVGIWQFPNGAAMYAYYTRDNTTTDLTPQEIHEIGLKEVKRIRAEMQAIIDKLGFRRFLCRFRKIFA